MESLAIFKRMLKRKHWLHRPWIPFLKAVEGGAFLERNIEAPVLDLACGDGVFTQCVFQKRLDAGLDLFLDDLKKAKAGGTHETLVHASAYESPFKSDQFGSVISVCAIEHMPELDRVLSEVSRVLRPGGTFVFTVPSIYFGENLLTPTIYKMFGLTDKAKTYADRKNARSQHYHVLSAEEWERRLAEHGMGIASSGYTLSRKVLLIWSFMGSFMFKPLMYPFRWMNSEVSDSLLESMLLLFLSGAVEHDGERKLSEGGYLVVEAVKK